MGKLVRTFFGVVALSLAAGQFTGARAAEPGGCALGGKYPVRSVAAYNSYEDAGYAAFTYFRGAEVFVPAQPGLTREWLQRVVSDELAAGVCDFGVRDAHAGVQSAGGGFTVRLFGKNEQEAHVILNHAQQQLMTK